MEQIGREPRLQTNVFLAIDGLRMLTRGHHRMHSDKKLRSADRLPAEAGNSSPAFNIDTFVREHGEDADLFAARQADLYLRDGDALNGARWLRIFRTVADRNIQQAKAVTASFRS